MKKKLKAFLKYLNDDIPLLRVLLAASLILFIFIFLPLLTCQPRTNEIKQQTPKFYPTPTKHIHHIVPAPPLKPKPTSTPTVSPTTTLTQTATATATPPGGGFRKIAFTSNRIDGRYYQIFMMDANGNNVERLTESYAFDRDPHFSHSGDGLSPIPGPVCGGYHV